MTIDREGLQRWYREAMGRRLEQLRGLRGGLAEQSTEALDAARAVAQSLRGSGGTYGYPELSEAAGLVESSADAQLYRRSEGLIEHVRRLALEDEDVASLGAEWLDPEADIEARGGHESLGNAWMEVCDRRGMTPLALAEGVAERFGLYAEADLQPSRAALRLVPEAFIRSSAVLPLREDAEKVVVATADPTDLDVEAELLRLTGRTPVFVVAPPEVLEEAIARLLEEPAHPARPRAQAAVATVPAAEAAPDRVLVVDDDAPARVLARRLLEKDGYSVEEAEDGRQALEVLEASGGAALIVADLNMPRLDGLELIWHVRERESWAGIPVIVVTGETDEILESKLIEEGADDYIRKPLDPRLFLARVAATIRRAET